MIVDNNMLMEAGRKKHHKRSFPPQTETYIFFQTLLPFSRAYITCKCFVNKKDMPQKIF